MSLTAISKHLNVLERAGLIARRRDAQRKLCRLEAGRLKEIAEWVETYRSHWEQSFERLDGLLEEMKREESRHGRKKARSLR
jgi:DNA-binding transcriptional ArsR family regulator